MSKAVEGFSIQSYIDKNRDSLDESLVSLRIMKEIDKILDYKKLSNKDLATRLGYSESYISQLMSGTKNVNVSFISKFEKSFSAEFEFRINLKNEERLVQKLVERIHFHLNINLNRIILTDGYSKFTYKQNNSTSMLDVIDIEHEML